MFEIIMLIVAALLMDYYFVGFISGKVGLEKWNSKDESFRLSMEAGRIRSNCFSSHGEVEQLRWHIEQTDSTFAVTDTSVYIGKKRLTHHYRIPFENIVKVECEAKMRRRILKLRADVNERACFVEVDNLILSKTESERFDEVVDFIKERVGHE